MNYKKKIINDPVFGFINIPNERIAHLLGHPYLQRLSRIKQLGLTSMVYPGAQHTRLHHSLGAMHLMSEAIHILRNKGHEITEDESNAALAAILLHDIGHGPFSHVLEFTLTNEIHHESISLALMHKLNKELGGELDMCIAIFTNNYSKQFLHQLVSGQLDMDRLDYLRRDSFFTGVHEGNIGSARIIKMLNIRNDKLVVEAKGIYSIENFLMARRLMYWQVYLHKTAVSAEQMLIKTLTRAKYLAKQAVDLFASPDLKFFLEHEVNKDFFETNKDKVIEHFVQIDDSDIWSALKVWSRHDDKILSILSEALVDRKLFKILIQEEKFSDEYINKQVEKYIKQLDISADEAQYLFSHKPISSNIYDQLDDSIDILFKDESIQDISKASDMLNIELLSKKIKKYHFSYLELL